jgi:gliding motility-associated lipoprotein GldJ
MIKKHKTFIKIVLLLFVFSLLGCGSPFTTNSPSTNWKVNDRVGGFYYNTKFKNQKTAPGMVFVEGGTFLRGKVQDDVMHEWNNQASRQHVQSFYMDETEVTNQMYGEYLYWVKTVFTPDNLKYINIYQGVLPDTLVWRQRLGYNENMTTNYLRHPAYGQYPVVGVNWIQANEFAKWRTDRLNELILEKNEFTKPDAKLNDINPETTFDTETYLASPTSTYGGKKEITLGGKLSKQMELRGTKKNLYVQKTDGILSPEYRLPTESEWEYAASADIGQRYTNTLLGQKHYPWSGKYTRSGKGKKIGDQLANFKQAVGDYSGVAGWSDDGSDITNRVKSYPPNEYGLYDMAGNVSEWVADIYRPLIDDETSDFNYFRGNVFMKNKKNPNGTFEIITPETQHFDTLSNGKIIARNFPGQIARVPVDDNETFLRANFDKSDNRDYRDGDQQSSRFFKMSVLNGTFDPKKALQIQNQKKRMYNSPVQETGVDSVGNIIKKLDKSNDRTSQISNKARVYKGGSWEDKAYWLDPAQRRFLYEEMSTNNIGFRCAMSRLGTKSMDRKRLRGYKVIKYTSDFIPKI